MSDAEEQTHSTTQPGAVNSNISPIPAHNAEAGKVKLKACTVVPKDTFKFGRSRTHCSGKTNSPGIDRPSCRSSYRKARSQKVIIAPLHNDLVTTKFTVQLCDNKDISQRNDSHKDYAKLKSSYTETSLQEVIGVKQTDFGREEIYVETLALRNELFAPRQEGASSDGDKAKVRVQKVVILATQEGTSGEVKTKFTVKLCDARDYGDMRICGETTDYDGKIDCADTRDCDDTQDCGDTKYCDDTRDCDDTRGCGDTRNCSDTRDCGDTSDYIDSNDAMENNRPKADETGCLGEFDGEKCTDKTCSSTSVEAPAVTRDFSIVKDDNYHKSDQRLTNGRRSHMSCSVCGHFYTRKHSTKRHLKHRQVKRCKCSALHTSIKCGTSDAAVKQAALASDVSPDDYNRDTTTDFTIKLHDTTELCDSGDGDKVTPIVTDIQVTLSPDVDAGTCAEKTISSTPAGEKNELDVNVDRKQRKCTKQLTDNGMRYVCSTCGTLFVRRDVLRRHEILHTGNKPNACSVCGEVFARKDTMNRHKLKHHQVNPEKYATLDACLDTTNTRKPMHSHVKPHQCEQCSKAFVSLAHLKNHAERHTVPRSRPRQSCSICGKLYSYSGIAQHMYTHTRKGSHVCDRCGKSFLQASALKRHKITHLSEKTFACSLCDKSFTCLLYLKKHEKLHAGIKPYLCVACGKPFNTSYRLHRHASTVHSDTRPYSCETCGKAFKLRERVKIHMRSHTGEKPYMCIVCGTSFMVSDALDVHKRIHANVKPYTCSVCGKSFVTLSQIRTHEKSHSGEKPHACSICGQTFTLPHHRRAHEKTHSNDSKKK